MCSAEIFWLSLVIVSVSVKNLLFACWKTDACVMLVPPVTSFPRDGISPAADVMSEPSADSTTRLSSCIPAERPLAGTETILEQHGHSKICAGSFVVRLFLFSSIVIAPMSFCVSTRWFGVTEPPIQSPAENCEVPQIKSSLFGNDSGLQPTWPVSPDFDTRKNILGLSKRTEAIFGRNMRQVIYGGEGQPNLPHGTNLVTDYIHYQRLGEIHSDIMIEIGRILGGTYKVIYWLTCNKIANKQEAVPVVHTLSVENTDQEVDDLMNAIQDSWREFTMKDIIS